MAKKQTRRSISVSRATYERLKAFCETQNISMSQVVEREVDELLASGAPPSATPRPVAPRPAVAAAPAAPRPAPAPVAKPAVQPTPAPARPATSSAPMSSAAARYAVDPPPPIIKLRETDEVKPPAQPTADQIFTF